MKYKYIICAIVGLTCCLFLGGCMCAKKTTAEDATKYLEDKYKKSFICKQNGAEAWSDSQKTFIFEDEKKSEFKVNSDKNSGEMSDNYMSVMFDKSFSKKYTEKFNGTVKCNFDTNVVFFDKNHIYSSDYEYMKNCNTIPVFCFSCDFNNYELVRSTLKNDFPNAKLSGDYTVVSVGTYNRLTYNNYELDYHDQRESKRW